MSAQFSDIYPFHKDTLAIDLYVKRSRTTLVNSYLHGDRFSDALNHLISNPIDQSGPVIWSGTSISTTPCGNLLLVLPFTPIRRPVTSRLDRDDLTIMNNINTPTRIGCKNQDSIIDLTLFNSCAAESGMTLIGKLLNTVEPNVLLEPEPGYIIDLECQDEWIEEYAHCIKAADLPNTCSTAEDLDRIANGILQAMSNAMKKVMPRKKKGKWKVRSPWWNDECNKLMWELKHSPRSQCAPALAALRGAIRRARRAHADEVCKKISTEKLFGLTNWYKGKRRAPLPPIQSGDTLVTEPQQKAQAFTNKFFPKSSMPTISLDPIGVPLHPERPHQPISDQEITNALKDTSNTSAPGAFGTNYRLLKWAYTANPDPIETLYNGCLDLGYHPSALRTRSF
ncbi:hypothetical protein OPQ81_004771 [Rhizoctonia solani]|nr:hypothetical protein OPQ81_004771 [Rhizoctonia solani]